MISSVAYSLELIVRTLFLRTIGSNIIILTLEQQVDVLEELNSGQSCRSELYSGTAANGASNDSHTID